MVSLKHNDLIANMPMRFIVKNVHQKTFTKIHTIHCKKFLIQLHVFIFDTNFEMINVVSSKMMKNMLLRSL